MKLLDTIAAYASRVIDVLLPPPTRKVVAPLIKYDAQWLIEEQVKRALAARGYSMTVFQCDFDNSWHFAVTRQSDNKGIAFNLNYGETLTLSDSQVLDLVNERIAQAFSGNAAS